MIDMIKKIIGKNNYLDIMNINNKKFVMSEIKLRIELKNKRPIDLVYLTDSLISLNNEYRRFIQSKNLKYTKETRLYVKEIRTGSIVTELVDLIPLGMAFATNSNTIIQFVNYLKGFYGFFGKNKGDKPINITKSSYQDLGNFIGPVAKDHSSQLNVGAINITGNDKVEVNFFFNPK